MTSIRRLAAACVLAVATLQPAHALSLGPVRVVPLPAATGPDGTRPALTRTDWLSVVNFYRDTAGVPRLREERSWAASEQAHARYMAANRVIGHSESPRRPYYSRAGDVAARNSNVMLSYGGRVPSDRSEVEGWMLAPFHAAGVIDPAVTSTAFGKVTVNGWTGAALDVLRGARSYGPPAEPVVWPGNGAQVPLAIYDGTEQPDPLSFCPGYRAPTGLPVIALLPRGWHATSSSITDAQGGSVGHCRFDAGSRGSPDAKAVLAMRNTVVLVPRAPLRQYVRYSVDLATDHGHLVWSFSVGEVTPPSRVAVKPLAPLQSTRTFPVAWTASDDQSGVASFDVRYRPPGTSSYASWQSRTTAGSASFDGIAGSTYCFSVRAYDVAGNRSAWSADRCTTMPLNNRQLAASPVLWLEQVDPAYYDTTASVSLVGTSTLETTATNVRRVAVVVTTCPACGALDVSLNGVAIGTVSTDAPAGHRRVLTVKTFASPVSGTLRLTVSGGVGQVTVEGVGLAPY